MCALGTDSERESEDWHVDKQISIAFPSNNTYTAYHYSVLFAVVYARLQPAQGKRQQHFQPLHWRALTDQ
jgi:hypothetical protein